MKDWKLVGNNVVVYNLDDGAIVKIKVEMQRAGRATNFKNPDGTPHYVINTGVEVNVTPPEKERMFSVQKPKQMNSKVPSHIG